MKARILVVDDEDAVRMTLVDILRLEGYEVDAVGSGEEALKALLNKSYDVILLDLKMPGMDGLEVMRAVGKIAPEAKVVVLTGHGSLESAIESLRFKVQDYILKPASTREILVIVARAVEQRAVQQRKRLILEQLDDSIRRLQDAEGLTPAASTDKLMISIGSGVMIDFERREIWLRDKRVVLTPTEGKLIKVLLEHRGQVITHKDLVFLVQGYETNDWEAPEVLRPLISRLRKKLSFFPNGEDWIVNVRGTGYVFDWEEQSMNQPAG